jgi:hypothetical protein
VRRRLWPWLAALLLGCGTTEERFPEQAAELYCDGLKSCDLDRYWEEFPTGREACRDEVGGEIAALQYGTENTTCSWVEAAGIGCLRDLRTASCDDVLDRFWFADCVQAWDCVIVVGSNAPR